MDLKDLKPTSNVVHVKVVHPLTGKPFLNDDETQMTLDLHAPHTKEYKSFLYNQVVSKRDNPKEDVNFDDIDEAALNMLSNIVKSWNISYDGSMPEYSAELAKEVFSEIFWLRNQVEEAINTFEVFTKA